MPVATIALFVLAVAVVAVAVFVLNQGDDDAPPIDDESATRTAQAADDETPTEGDETPSTPADGTPGAETATEDPDATPAAETPTAGGGEEGTYEVVAGDTCGGIATSEGITLQELLDANGLTEEDCLNIQPGDILEIP
jgi:LysM repeat protein